MDPYAASCTGIATASVCGDRDLAVANGVTNDASVLLSICPGCPADFDGDGIVGCEDLGALLDAWGNKGGPEDIDGSGSVDFGDLLIVLDSSQWVRARPP